MKRTIPIALALMAGGLLIPLTASAQDRDEVDEALATLRETDSGIDGFLADSEGYAIFPSVGKAGFGIGGARGSGLVFRGGEVVGKVKLTQISIGLQFREENHCHAMEVWANSKCADGGETGWSCAPTRVPIRHL